MINLKNVKPNKVETNIKAYNYLILGQPKIGKTGFAYELFGDKALFIMTEDRYSHIDGINAVRVRSWSDFLSVLSQLYKDKELYDTFNTIVIDTVDNLAELCEQYVATQFMETFVGQKKVDWSGDYVALRKEWERVISKILSLPLNVNFIGHTKTITSDNDGIEKTVMRVHGRFGDKIKSSVDNIISIYLDTDTFGNPVRKIALRDTGKYEAGCTFPDLPDTIELSVDALKDAFFTYLNKKGTVTNVPLPIITEPEIKFEELLNEAISKAKVILAKIGEDRSYEITDLANDIFGEGVKLQDIKPKQIELLKVFILRLDEIK